MNRLELRILFLLCVMTCLAPVPKGFAGNEPIGSAFTYQGRLMQNGEPVSEAVNLIFTLFNAAIGGEQIGPTLGAAAWPVEEGLLTIHLDFGEDVFNENRRWLEITVNGTTLAPRQPVMPTPVAQFALKPWQMVGANTFYTGGNVGIGTASPDVPLRVAGSFVSGSLANAASGSNSFSGGGLFNTASGSRSFVGGGESNTASGFTSFVGGGTANVASGFDCFIGGGDSNTASGNLSFIGGGRENVASGTNSFAAGRRAKAMHDGTFVWADNTAADFPSTSENQFLIRAGGGVGIGTNSPQALLHLNSDSTHRLLMQSGVHVDLVLGRGDTTRFGNLVFADGHPAQSSNWRWGIGLRGGNSNLWFYDEANSTPRMVITQGGRAGIGTSAPERKLHVVGDRIRLSDPAGAKAIDLRADGNKVDLLALDTDLFLGSDGPAGNNHIIMNQVGGGVGIGTAAPGGFKLAVNGSAAKPGGGSWSVFSDARLKHSIEVIEHGMLDRLLALNGYTFEYHDEAIENRLALPGRQIGLLAHEVAEVFPDWVDEDDEGYLFVTERGTTAIMVEALRELRAEKDAEIESMHDRIEQLETIVATLAEMVEGGSR